MLRIFFLFFIILQPVILNSEDFEGMAPYRKKTVKTIKATVKKIKIKFNRVMSEEGLHLIVKNSLGEYIVHVCPKWYEDKKKFNFLKGEILIITGSTFEKDGKKNIYASSIKRRFSSLSKKQQIKIASEILINSDISSISEKYNISISEVKNIKTRVKLSLDTALFPESLKLRDKNTGDGLWGGRYFEENMQKNRNKKQIEMREKRRGRGNRGRYRE